LSRFFVGVLLKKVGSSKYSSSIFQVERVGSLVSNIKLITNKFSESGTSLIAQRKILETKGRLLSIEKNEDIPFKMIIDKKELNRNAFLFDIMDIKNHSKLISDYNKYEDIIEISRKIIQPLSNTNVFYVDDTNKSISYRIDIQNLNLATLCILAVVNYSLKVKTNLIMEYYGAD